MNTRILFIILLIITTSCYTEEEEVYQQPNILLCIADDASWASFGAYGSSYIKTPTFDRIAKEGILFLNAYAPNSKGSTTRASLLTGRNTWQLGKATNHNGLFPSEFKTFIEVLHENDYEVGYTGKGWEPGTVALKNGASRELTGKRYNKHHTAPFVAGLSTNNYQQNFRDFLQERKTQKPFFFWFGSEEPHRDFKFESGLHIGGKRVSDIHSVPNNLPNNTFVRKDLLDYAMELEYFDSQLAGMMAILKNKNLTENTIIIVISDNGMSFPGIKGSLSEYACHIPLVVNWPKEILHKGAKVESYVGLIDIAPTLLDIIGIDAKKSGMKSIQGKSFLPTLLKRKGKLPPDRNNYVLLGKERNSIGRPSDKGYPTRAIVIDRKLYKKNYRPQLWPAGNPETGYLNCEGGPSKSSILLLNRDEGKKHYWNINFDRKPSEEFYDLEIDPFCTINRIDEEKYSDDISIMREVMETQLLKQNDARVLGKGDTFEGYPYTEKETKDFYNRYIIKGEPIKAPWVNRTDYETQTF